MEKTPADSKINEISQYVNGLEKQMNAVRKQAEHLIKRYCAFLLLGKVILFHNRLLLIIQKQGIATYLILCLSSDKVSPS